MRASSVLRPWKRAAAWGMSFTGRFKISWLRRIQTAAAGAVLLGSACSSRCIYATFVRLMLRGQRDRLQLCCQIVHFPRVLYRVHSHLCWCLRKNLHVCPCLYAAAIFMAVLARTSVISPGPALSPLPRILHPARVRNARWLAACCCRAARFSPTFITRSRLGQQCST